MLRLVVYSAVVLAHVATGAPSARNFDATSPAPAATASPPQIQQNPNQIKPVEAFAEEERELESLKHIIHGESQINKNNTGAANVANEKAVPPKLPANEEHPAPSDNDNDNLERLFGRPLSIRSTGNFPFESEEAALKAKKANSFPSGFNGVTDEFILGESSPTGEFDVTARDMAEYLYWTGDEDSVMAALEVYIDEGLVSEEEMLLFLNQVRDQLLHFQNTFGDRHLQTSEYEPAWKPRFDVARPKPGRYYNLFKNGGDKRSSQMDFGMTTGDYPLQVPVGFKASFDNDEDEEQDLLNMDDVVWKSEMDRLAQMQQVQIREEALEDMVYSLAKKLFQEQLQEKPQKSVQSTTTFSQQLGASLPADLNRDVHDSLNRALLDAVAEEAKNWARRDQIVSKELDELTGAAIPLTRASMTSENKIKTGRQGSFSGSGTLRKM